MNTHSMQSTAQTEEEAIDLRDLFVKLYKRKWIIISMTVITTTLALIYSFMHKPVYSASARILVDRKMPRIVQFEDISYPDLMDTMTFYNSQVEILKSDSIARMVFDRINGYKPWDPFKGRDYDYEKQPSTDSLVRALNGVVSVSPVRRSQIIEITAEDINPKLAANIVNTWVEAYISYMMESRSSLTQYASDWLEQEIAKAKVKVKLAENNLQTYRKKYSIIDVSTNEKESQEILNELIARKAELEVELSQQLNYYKEKHPVIIGLRSELMSVDEKIDSEKERLLSLKDTGIQYGILNREVETSQALYESLLNRLKETKSIEALKLSNTRIVDSAKVPSAPIKPNKRLNVMLALMLGVFIGTGFALLFESLDQSIKTSDDVEKSMGLSLLGLIPVLKERKKRVDVIAATDARGSVTEGFKSLRTNILFSNPDVRKRTFLITSAVPSEGKTTVATNLAVVMAQAGEKTLLIDTDLRHPKLHNIFKIVKNVGITDILTRNEENISACIHKTDVPGLDLMLCGTIPPNPSELLGAQSMEWFIEQVLKKYDRVIFDTPPVLAATDAVILSTKVDASLFVIKAHETYKKAAQRAAQLISSVDSKLLGVVLNMVEQEKHGGRYYYYHYHYGYGRKNKKETAAS